MDSIYSKLIEQVIDRAWIIKTKYPKYKPQRNLKWPVTVFISIAIRESNNERINAMVYYSYYLYIGIIGNDI